MVAPGAASTASATDGLTSSHGVTGFDGDGGHVRVVGDEPLRVLSRPHLVLDVDLALLVVPAPVGTHVTEASAPHDTGRHRGNGFPGRHAQVVGGLAVGMHVVSVIG